MCVNAQIPNRGAEFFLLMVAETSTLDALCILYVFLNFSRSDSINSAYIHRKFRTGHVRILYVVVSFSSSSSMNSQISSKTSRGKETSIKISQATAR